MSKRTKKAKLEAVVDTAIPQSAPQIAPELLRSVAALHGISTCHNLLDKGAFAIAYSDAIKSSMDFLKVLHTQVREEAFNHPDCDKVPELKALKDQMEAATKAVQVAQNGQA